MTNNTAHARKPGFFSRSRWAAPLLTALIFWVALVVTYNTVTRMQRAYDPVSNWMVVNQISVPSFEEGQDPIVVYDRTVKQHFRAEWVVEVQPVTDEGGVYSVCSGSGINDYSPDKKLPALGVSWSWFIGSECRVPAGRYRLSAVWQIDRGPLYPPVKVTHVSNVFLVLPRKMSELIVPKSTAPEIARFLDTLRIGAAFATE